MFSQSVSEIGSSMYVIKLRFLKLGLILYVCYLGNCIALL